MAAIGDVSDYRKDGLYQNIPRNRVFLFLIPEFGSETSSRLRNMPRSETRRGSLTVIRRRKKWFSLDLDNNTVIAWSSLAAVEYFLNTASDPFKKRISVTQLSSAPCPTVDRYRMTNSKQVFLNMTSPRLVPDRGGLQGSFPGGIYKLFLFCSL